MSDGAMPKRNRATSTNNIPARTPASPATAAAVGSAHDEVIEITDSPPTQPTRVEAMPPAPTVADVQLDPILEQQLDELDVDEDFRESIRAMTPDTRRDILNDIIRHQQHTDMQQSLGITGGFGGGAIGGPLFGHAEEVDTDDQHHHHHHHGGSDDDDDWEDGDGVESIESDEDVDEHPGHRQRGYLHGGAPLPPFMFGTTRMVPTEDLESGMPRVHAFGGEQDGGPMSIIDFLQFVAGHMGGPPGPTGRGGRGAYGRGGGAAAQRAALEERMLNLQNLVGMLQQANTMQSMGLERDIDDMSYEELLELEERIGNVSKGVPPALMDACMTPESGPAGEGTCPICQEEMNAPSRTSGGEATPSASQDRVCVRLLNCQHVFHKGCVKQWLVGNKTCPVCKQEVLPQSASSPS